MVVLFGSDASVVARIQTILEKTVSVRRAHRWWEVETSLPSTQCAVLVMASLRDEAAYAQLAALKAAAPAYPVVLVTTRCPDNARELKSLIVEEVLWTCEVGQHLEGTVDRVRRRGVLAQVAAEVGAVPGLAPRLREALLYACTADLPVDGVGALADAVKRDRCTLARQWKRAVGEGPALRLEDCLGWLLLLRAVEARGRLRKWSAVTDELKVHPQTLARLAQRLGGAPPAALAAAGTDALLAGFRASVLARLPVRGTSHVM